ncbi:hypothetical protein PYCCODRAFT_1440549 [Trametes coccinea BRFM310]|uniref:CFEM domain-containing protein n=1 Tax=Trametes coccinea (strain BRFM310) TaxID=1353009 RepID=A0A1Y2I7A0_TRAC3|nr:hypothetical protein PYCCODRAFT_1440549 [Trametes coccinea BRFM310]
MPAGKAALYSLILSGIACAQLVPEKGWGGGTPALQPEAPSGGPLSSPSAGPALSACSMQCFTTAARESNCEDMSDADCACSHFLFSTYATQCIVSACPQDLGSAEEFYTHACASAAGSALSSLFLGPTAPTAPLGGTSAAVPSATQDTTILPVIPTQVSPTSTRALPATSPSTSPLASASETETVTEMKPTPQPSVSDGGSLITSNEGQVVTTFITQSNSSSAPLNPPSNAAPSRGTHRGRELPYAALLPIVFVAVCSLSDCGWGHLPFA